jgi:integrase
MRYKLIPPKQRGRKFWYYRGKVGDKRVEYSTGASDRAGAEAWAFDFHTRIKGRPAAGSPIKYPVAAAAYRAFKKPKGKEIARHDRLDAHFENWDIGDMKHAHLVEAANVLFPKGSAGTKNREVISPASAVLHYAADQEWCAYRKFRRFKEARRSNRKPVSDADMVRLLNATEKHKRLFLMLAYETGLRLGNILALRADQLDLSNASLTVDVTKTGDRIALRLSPSLVAMLANTDRCEGGKLLPWHTPSGVYKWLWPLRKALGVHYTPHLSRHALATDLLKAKVPDRIAAAAGAWQDERSLHRYQHVETGDLPLRDSGELRGTGKAKA